MSADMPRLPRGPALAVLIACALVAPQARPAAGDGPLRFARLTVDDGLPQSSVMRILQDRLGFMWFATEEGLGRYDGHRFVTHRAGEAPGMLANSNITALIEDHAGDLWVGTSLGLHRLDIATGRFTREGGPATANVDVADVVEDAAGRIWFTGHDNGLYLLERPPGGGDGVARQVSATALACSGGRERARQRPARRSGPPPTAACCGSKHLQRAPRAIRA
jgi:ligand-binding sensor domain-containing protein